MVTFIIIFVTIAILLIAFLAIIVNSLTHQVQQANHERDVEIKRARKLEQDAQRLHDKIKQLSLVADVWAALPRRIDANRQIGQLLAEHASKLVAEHREVAFWLREADAYMVRLGKAFGADYNGPGYNNFRPSIDGNEVFDALSAILEESESTPDAAALAPPAATVVTPSKDADAALVPRQAFVGARKGAVTR